MVEYGMYVLIWITSIHQICNIWIKPRNAVLIITNYGRHFRWNTNILIAFARLKYDLQATGTVRIGREGGSIFHDSMKTDKHKSWNALELIIASCSNECYTDEKLGVSMTTATQLMQLQAEVTAKMVHIYTVLCNSKYLNMVYGV